MILVNDISVVKGIKSLIGFATGFFIGEIGDYSRVEIFF